MSNYNYVVPKCGELPPQEELNALIRKIVISRLPCWGLSTVKDLNRFFACYSIQHKTWETDPEGIILFWEDSYRTPEFEGSKFNYLKHIVGKRVPCLVFDRGPVSPFTRFINNEIRKRVCLEIEAFDVADTVDLYPIEKEFKFYETFWDQEKTYISSENPLEISGPLMNKLTWVLESIGEAPQDIYNLLGLPDGILYPFLTSASQEARKAAKKALEKSENP